MRVFFKAMFWQQRPYRGIQNRAWEHEETCIIKSDLKTSLSAAFPLFLASLHVPFSRETASF